MGFDNGDVKLFDLRTNTMRWEGNVSNGACWVEFDRKNIETNKLMVCTLESRFRMYDMRTFHEGLCKPLRTGTQIYSVVWSLSATEQRAFCYWWWQRQLEPLQILLSIPALHEGRAWLCLRCCGYCRFVANKEFVHSTTVLD